jgi:Fur family transcriptional regulator, ferric uptake regulator
MDRLEEYLAKNSLKMTDQRKIILEVFGSLDHHASLEELQVFVQQKKQGIGQATIYRTMKLFTDAGIALERRFEDGLTRYELHIEGDHHDHLICIKCKQIIEFEDDTIELRQELIASQNGMKIISHKLELYGECLDVKSCTKRIK